MYLNYSLYFEEKVTAATANCAVRHFMKKVRGFLQRRYEKRAPPKMIHDFNSVARSPCLLDALGEVGADEDVLDGGEGHEEVLAVDAAAVLPSTPLEIR